MIAEVELFAKVHEKLPDYGFILRYSKGKEDISGCAYEPWHLRFINDINLAKELKISKQRRIVIFITS